MSATHRIEWADGTRTEVAFRLLPLVQLELEDEFGEPAAQLMVGPMSSKVFLRALWRQQQLRHGVTDGFEEWAARIDDVQMLVNGEPVAFDADGKLVEPPPLDATESSSPSGSSEPDTTQVSPFET